MRKFTKPLAFVVPRFGSRVGGGAETLVRGLAERLAAQGEKVEVLTTCALDNRTWKNELAPGISEENGLTVRRFPVNRRDLEKWIPRQIAISEGRALSVDEQLEWMEHSVNSSGLYSFIATDSKRFEALFFAPYLFGTTFWGSLIDPGQSILIPCLHDEYYAYLEIVQVMFKEVRGALFNTQAEQDLAQRLYGKIKGEPVGMGFEPAGEGGTEGLSAYFSEDFPYVLYFGRKETGKNVQVLVDYFCGLKDSFAEATDLRLVTAGSGDFTDLNRPEALKRDDIIDLGYVSEEEKRRLINGALVVCQPSINESFSIVIMESWLLKTPVLVNARCPVTRSHVLESGGGLYFDSAEDFCGAVLELCRSADLRRALGVAGRHYVLNSYSWEAVMRRFHEALGNLFAENNKGFTAQS